MNKINSFLFLIAALLLCACGRLDVGLDMAPNSGAAATPGTFATALPTQPAPEVSVLPSAVPPTAGAEPIHLTWEEKSYANAYSFRYPLELYSVRQGSAIPSVNWPGVIELSPNDSFNDVLGQPVSQTYRILIAVQNNDRGWTMEDPAGFMSGAGALLTHSAELIDANHPVQEYSIGGIKAFRVDNLPTGLAGAQTHI